MVMNRCQLDIILDISHLTDKGGQPRDLHITSLRLLSLYQLTPHINCWTSVFVFVSNVLLM